MKVQVDPLQARILGILKDWYPITVKELRDELAVSPIVLERSLKSLMMKGVIALEPLSDKTYIRLLIPEVVFDVDKPKSKKRSRRAPPVDDGQSDSMMYR